MARRSKNGTKFTGIAFLLVALLIVSGVGAGYNALSKAWLSWLLPVAFAVGGVGIVILLIWSLNDRNKQLALQKQEQEQARVAAISAHKDEWGEDFCSLLLTGKYPLDARVNGIMSHLNEWGEDFCKFLITGRYPLDSRVSGIIANLDEWGEDFCRFLITGKYQLDTRVSGIASHIGEWGKETCINLLQKIIGIGMSADMVRLSLGEPTTIDQRDVSSKGEKYRWIYGVPRHGAAYIWLQDDKVKRIKQ